MEEMIINLLKCIGQRYLVEMKNGKMKRLEILVRHNLLPSLSVSFQAQNSIDNMHS